MGNRPIEVADIVRTHEAEYVASRGGLIPLSELRVLRAIRTCRTDALGGHVDRCDGCGHMAISYNSCRNRHCPKCQSAARVKWMKERESELLPIPYFHIVFTLPREIAALARWNPKVVYDLLFKVSAETLRQVAADPEHLGAQVGILSVLHTWGQNLQHHPHVHCIVSGGGLSCDGESWVSTRPDFFAPVKVLGRLFRGKFLSRLKAAHKAGKLRLGGALQALLCGKTFADYLRPLYAKEWVVYSKRPFGSPSRVLKYLARYTHRVAISNGRLVKLEHGHVYFTWRDYAHGGKTRVMPLPVVEFLRRFLIHVLPKGFVRIRHYGFLANRHRREKLNRCRQLLNAPVAESTTSTAGESVEARVGAPCPSCGKGIMAILWYFDPGERPCKPVAIDSS